MKKSSRQVIFINTAPPNERVQLLKPINDILEMEDDCEEVYTGGLLQRYAIENFRPKWVHLRLLLHTFCSYIG